MAIVIGIDLGTTTLTALAVDLPAGRVVAWATSPTPPFDTPNGVTILLRAGLALLSDVATSLGPQVRDVAGIGITGQQHGVLLIDDRLRPITPFYNWQDGTGNEKRPDGRTWAEHARELVGDAPERTGSPLRSGFGVVTLYAKRDILPPRATACSLMDLFGTILTGLRPVTEPTCAASLGALDLQRRDWDRPTLEALGLPLDWFPEVVPSGTNLGGIMSAAAEWTKLPEGLPVLAGIGDNQASFLGSVGDPTTTILVNVGTGGQVTTYSGRYLRDDALETRPFVDGGYLLVSAGQTGGAAFATLGEFFKCIDGRDWLDDLVRLASEVPAGCAGLRCEPYFRGTRLDPERRASFTGISEANFTPGHLARALLEGMARTFADSYALMERLRGDRLEHLVGAGNGVRANPLLPTLLAEAFARPVRVPAHREEAAFGAALVAGVGLGVLPSFLEAGRVIRYDEAESFPLTALENKSDAHHP